MFKKKQIVEGSLDKMLKEYLPKKEKSKYLLWPFIILSVISLVGIFIFSFCFCDCNPWKNICLSISSGLFGSGVCAAIVEAMTIRNKKALIKEKMEVLYFHCKNLIDQISDGFEDDGIERIYKDWIIKIFKENNNQYVKNNLYDRLNEISKSCYEFSNSNFNRFDNPFLGEKKYNYVHELSFLCRYVLQNIDCKETPIRTTTIEILSVKIPNTIILLFKDLNKDFEKIIPVIDILEELDKS